MMIEVNEVVKDFGLIRALDGVSLTVDGFKTVFGPNGAGKTTLVKVISSLMEPSSGNVVVDGVDLEEDPVGVRARIGVVSHETYLYDRLTARENLVFYGGMYGVDEERVDEMLSVVGLEGRRLDRVEEFSRGMKQRVSIARALLHDPQVLLLDEPYTGLDLKAAEVFRNLLARLEDKTILMTTHNTERGLELCDSVSIMIDGKIVFDEEVGEVDVDEFKERYRRLTGSATHD
ncbi:ABC transporter ATP-binding protein [Methanonatronarchaeum sp. AMET6-2]|uniref:ABC transporter ATP-binding protein n=1 Tax=Methanonatronarchaeum sp. AMET6-2 TaxID=2933293 RepID=UPI001FF13DDD|nr:ABC transporter ATP-binding protein [Methanonatronarchaeum sp. AMET6-2]UOY10443.1 ABC transporter ATP-binding protein [Methanonatronarchaeum sp. AMET6-2]